MSCQAGPGIEHGPSALKASALPIELTWQTSSIMSIHQTNYVVLQRYPIPIEIHHTEVSDYK